MIECCGTCEAYTPDPLPTGFGPATTKAGYGMCRHLQESEFPEDHATKVSSWPWGCRFTPSRYVGPDPDPEAHSQVLEQFTRVLEGPRAPAEKDDRPPLELT